MSVKTLIREDIAGTREGWEFTSAEILGQPGLWQKLPELVQGRKEEIAGFLAEARGNPDLHVVVTGAGTSAFIGEVLEGPFQKATGLITKAVATTDLVTHPRLYFQKDKDVLLISFARSGDSPESVKAVELAEELCRKSYNLIVTCNRAGKLVQVADRGNSLVLALPPESEDKSLAMTGSFTSMLLVGLLIAGIDHIGRARPDIALIAGYANRIFDDYLPVLQKVAAMEFERALFLGSGVMKGVARESQLKMQELTDGRVICKYDSFLGLRHGPKAVINERTLIVYLFSNDKYANLYERDLVRSVGEGRRPLFSIGVMERDIPGVEVDLKIILGDEAGTVSEHFLSVVSVLPAQVLGFLKSVRLGLSPDNPSESGMIHRVVKGVNIYPLDKSEGD